MRWLPQSSSKFSIASKSNVDGKSPNDSLLPTHILRRALPHPERSRHVHFHMIFPDGVYMPGDQSVFHHVAAPTSAQLQVLVQQIAERVGRLLERRGLVERDMENAWLATDGRGGPLGDLIGHSITYRIAVGPRAGHKLFTLQTLSASAIPEAE